MRRLFVLLFIACAAPAFGQAPKITSQGDPSVKADSIYRLAVKPADYPEEDAAFLLDDGVLRLDADGRGTRTYRQIVQVLKQGAVERLQERTWTWSPKHQKLRVNWVKVVRPDGTVISSKPSHVQESDIPADDENPIYTDRRVWRGSLSGVAPGTIVDYSYTIEETKPFLPGDFFETWSVSTGLRVARSRYIIDVPATLQLNIHEKNLNFARKESSAAGRKSYMWATGNLPKVVPEPLAADSNDVYMSVLISSPMTWNAIGKWYADLARPNTTFTPALAAKVDSMVRGARTRDDSIRAVHKWVAQDVRYVAIDLGVSGYQPRKPALVNSTGFGDCKDKATLFVMALNHLNITAYPVLLSSGGGVRKDMPSIEQFDHEIAAVKIGSGYQYADLTASLVPYGELPGSEHGEFGLVVHPDGSSEEIIFPKNELNANRTERRLTGVLSPDGEFNGSYEERGYGNKQYGLRSALENPLDSAQRWNGAQSIASKFFQGATGDSLTGSNGKDLLEQPYLRILVKHGRAATPAGSNMIFHLPIGNMSGMTSAAKELTNRGKRVFPIDAEKFWGRETATVTVTVTLPAGWKAELPKSLTERSAFGTYEATYAQTGDQLVIKRTVTGATGIFPPERIADFVTWLNAVGKDDPSVIVLTRPASPGL